MSAYTPCLCHLGSRLNCPVHAPRAKTHDERCPACEGIGLVIVYDESDPETCERCSGSGVVSHA